MPVLTAFAGPNGSGKSSILKKLQFAGRDNLLEADAIAVRIDASDPRGPRLGQAAKFFAAVVDTSGNEMLLSRLQKNSLSIDKEV